MNVIKELWHGNIVPGEDSRTNSKEMKELLGYMARHHGDLAKTFTDEQKETFKKFTISFFLFRYIIYNCGIKLLYLRIEDYSQSFGKIIILRPNMRRVFYEQKNYRYFQNAKI